MANYSRKIIAEGVGYSTVIDPKFKTNRIQVAFLTELLKETAAENAVGFGILATSNCNYKTITEITEKLSTLYGASINVNISKQGDFQQLVISITSIHNRYALEGEDLSSEITQLLLDCIFSPNVKDGEFAQEMFDFRKKDLLDSINAEINNKRSYAIMQAGKKAYTGENAGNSPYGDKETANAVTPKSAYEAYRKLLTDAQVEIFFVGPEEDKSVEEKMTKAFSAMNRKKQNYNFIAPSPVKNEVCCFEEKLDVKQCKMVMVFKTDNPDRNAVKLMNTIFGGTPFSKLFMNVREKLSLCYYCSSSFNSLKRTIVIDSGVEEENIQKAQQEIINQLEEMKKGNFTQEELDNTLLTINNALKGIGDTPGSYINWYHEGIIRDKIYTPDELIEKYYAVTREQIIEAAKSLKLDTVYIMKGEN